MPPAEKIKTGMIRGRRCQVIQTYAEDPLMGADYAAELFDERCPEGFHPFRAVVEKDSKGRRASVQVWFRENLRREG